MSYFYGRLEARSLDSIDQDRNSRGGNTGHDKFGESKREIEIKEGLSNKRPFKPIKCFFLDQFLESF